MINGKWIVKGRIGQPFGGIKTYEFNITIADMDASATTEQLVERYKKEVAALSSRAHVAKGSTLQIEFVSDVIKISM